MVTSAHCDYNPWGNAPTWKHNGLTIGSVQYNAVQNGHSYDVSRTRIDGGWFNSPYRNKILRNYNNADFPLTGQNSTYSVGIYLRRTGFRSSTSGGEITNSQVLYTVSQFGSQIVLIGVLTDITSLAGDSGGPVWRLNSSGGSGFLAGFWSASNSNSTGGVFTRSTHAKTSLNIDYWCFTTSC